MASCGVARLVSGTCPSECPYWSLNAVWRHVGTCSSATDCSLYNPLLHYADKISNMCLPCKVFGCVSCAYSEGISNLTAGDVKLPDVCLKCAGGYKLSLDGKSCFLIASSVFSVAFWLVVFTVCIVLGLHALLNPQKYRDNRLAWNEAQQRNPAPESGDSMFSILDFGRYKKLGRSYFLYFRFLTFVLVVALFILVFSVAHAHFETRGMIRLLNQPISYKLETPPPSSELYESMLHFESVDKAIDYNVRRYADQTASVMRVTYVTIMTLTLIFIVSQKRIGSSYVGSLQSKTLILSKLPTDIVQDSQLRKLIGDAVGMHPTNVCICYKIRQHRETLNEILSYLEPSETDDLAGSYINIDFTKPIDLVTELGLKGSGYALVSFGNYLEALDAKTKLKAAGYAVKNCYMTPDQVSWENWEINTGVGKCACTLIAIVGILLAWTILFFIPYAAYRIHSELTDVYETLWLSIFVALGGATMSWTLHFAIDSLGLVNIQNKRALLMWSDFIMQTVVMGLNVLVTHATNYGGRSKLSWLLHPDFGSIGSATYKVGEEVSISLSFSNFMASNLVVVPLVFGFAQRTLLPHLTKLLCLLSNLDKTTITRLAKYPEFDLAGRYCQVIVYAVNSLLVHVLVTPKTRSVMTSGALLLHVLICIVKDHFTLVFKSARVSQQGHETDSVALTMWAVPCAMLAMLPAYWRFRAETGGVFHILKALGIHITLYAAALLWPSAYDVMESARGEDGDIKGTATWQSVNPVYIASKGARVASSIW